MSRVGRVPVAIPKGVTVAVVGEVGGGEVRVKGPKGELRRRFPRVAVKVDGDQAVVERPSDEKADRALHGAVRAHVANMVRGVTEGYAKTLLLEGVGYRAQVQGNRLSMTLGFSHPVVLEIPQGLKVSVEESTKVRVEGIDKEAVGALAARIRAAKPAEPYQGKGVRYEGETIRRKAGKSAAGAGAGAGGAKA
jgi:large subunit ribosomal protein L6